MVRFLYMVFMIFRLFFCKLLFHFFFFIIFILQNLFSIFIIQPIYTVVMIFYFLFFRNQQITFAYSIFLDVFLQRVEFPQLIIIIIFLKLFSFFTIHSVNINFISHFLIYLFFSSSFFIIIIHFC